MSVYLVQLLCPLRHCVLGAAYDDKIETTEDAKIKIEEGITACGLRRRCGICGSSLLTFESAKTPFNSIEEAKPFLIQVQMENLRSRAVLDELGLTADVKELKQKARNN